MGERMGRSERRGMGAWQQQGRVGAWRPDGRPRLEKAASLKKASGGQVARWMDPRQSHVCDSGKRKCRYVFF
jgi:hypothetical protein